MKNGEMRWFEDVVFCVLMEKYTMVRSIRIDGFSADFFYDMSDNPREALILLGGSEGGE